MEYNCTKLQENEQEFGKDGHVDNQEFHKCWVGKLISHKPNLRTYYILLSKLIVSIKKNYMNFYKVGQKKTSTTIVLIL